MDVSIRRSAGRAGRPEFRTCGSRARQVPIYCPRCGKLIEVTVGLCGNRLVEAILLQAEVIGAELECRLCRHRFIYHRVQRSRSIIE